MMTEGDLAAFFYIIKPETPSVTVSPVSSGALIIYSTGSVVEPISHGVNLEFLRHTIILRALLCTLSYRNVACHCTRSSASELADPLFS